MASDGAKKAKRSEKVPRRSNENSLMIQKVSPLTKKSKKKRKGTEKVKRKFTDDPEGEPSDEKKSKKKKKESKFQASWMKRMGEDPDKPLREADAGMEIDESELRTYNDGNPKPKSTTEEKGAGDRDDRDWGAWKPRSRQVA